MDPSYWLGKWQVGDIRFHRSAPHQKLVRGFSRLAPGQNVMVPLCGKSTDLLWLKSQGHTVTGIELSEIACEAFFTENELSFTRRTEGAMTIFAGEGITLWCGNFFDVPALAWQSCTALYDRAALVALPEGIRDRYARVVCERVGPAFVEMLLVTVDYASEPESGPPFSVDAAEIARLYGERFSIRKIEADVDHELSERRQTEVRETAYKLQNL